MAKKGVPYRRNSRSTRAYWAKSRQLWRRCRPGFVAAIEARQPLPGLVGGVQRGVIASWCGMGAPVPPKASGFRAVLEALAIDQAEFAEYLAHLSADRTTVYAWCPVCKENWQTTTSTL